MRLASAPDLEQNYYILQALFPDELFDTVQFGASGDRPGQHDAIAVNFHFYRFYPDFFFQGLFHRSIVTGDVQRGKILYFALKCRRSAFNPDDRGFFEDRSAERCYRYLHLK